MKTNTPHNNRLTLLTLLLGALIFSGCGAKKTLRGAGIYEGASRLNQDAGASCSVFSSKDATLDGTIQTYELPNGTFVPDMMRVRLSGITEEFSSNGKYVLKFFRAEAYPDNRVHIDETPLEVSFESDSGQVLSGYMNSVSMTDVTAVRRNHALGSGSATDFFRKTDIVISDVDLRWDVLIIALYENTSESESRLVGDVRVLMPEFAADPNVYMTDHPSVLHALHPFYAYRDSKTTNFTALASSYCW